jgi:hypothetical protein
MMLDGPTFAALALGQLQFERLNWSGCTAVQRCGQWLLRTRAHVPRLAALREACPRMGVRGQRRDR